MSAKSSAECPSRKWRALAAALVLAAPAAAYDFITDFAGPFPIAWNPGVVPVNIRMPASPPLLDGTTYNTTVEAAVREWNSVLGTIQLAPTILPPADNVNGNGINEVVMTPTINGSTFGTNVLAVALTRVTGTTRAEGDVLFNPIWNWDSYRGPRAANPERFDMRRVALHELGHVLGLDHPDEDTPPQNAIAIMNSRISNTLDALQPDDIAGAQALYGAPGFVPSNNNFASATSITADLPVAIPGTNVAANKEPGEPAHAGDGGGRSVWWRWTAPSVGSAALTTTGSLFDTLLAVYTGSSLSNLSPVASNNDAATGVRTSALTFSTTAGTTYHIAVDGVSGDAAPLVLNLAFASGGTPPPLIRRQPASLFVSPGGSVVLSVDTAGASSFQWLRNGVALPGATGATLTLSGTEANSGDYQVQVTSPGGTLTSETATVSLLAAPLPNQTVALGRNVSFAIPSSNNAVQWQLSSNGGASWSNVPNDSTFSGGTSSQLTLSGATTAHHNLQFRYQLTAPGNSGSATSAPATLTVAPLVLPNPSGAVSDGSGGLLVTDATADAVFRVTASGQVTTFAGVRDSAGSVNGSATSARFSDPVGIARDPASGNVFVADSGNHAIRQIDPSGNVTTVAGSSSAVGSQDGAGNAARFNSPQGIARAPDGSLYVADTQNHTIRRIVLPGTVTTFAGSPGQSGSQDGMGNAARFNQPRGLAFDAAGNLYVADTGNHLIRRISPAGAVTTLAGKPGLSGTFDATPGTGALFNEPTGIVVGPDGNLYVTDVNTSFVRRFSLEGAVSTLAGLTRTTSLKDGTGRDAWFNQPRAISVSGDALIVADSGNAALRRLATDGTVTTLTLSGPANTPPATPAPVPTPNPAPTPSGGGGGGGSPSLLFALLVSSLLLVRRLALCRPS